MELKDVKSFLEHLDQDNISFDPHFYERSRERPLSEGMVRHFLSQLDKLEQIEQGREENRFKLWFKMSSKYSLIIIIKVDLSKDLKVISAWNTDRKWQAQLRR